MYDSSPYLAFTNSTKYASKPKPSLQHNRNTSNMSARPLEPPKSPPQDPGHPLNFYLNFSKKPVGVSQTSRNPRLFENCYLGDENYTTEPTNQTHLDMCSPKGILKPQHHGPHKSIGSNSMIYYQEGPTKQQKAKSRGIDTLGHGKIQKAQSTTRFVVTSPKVPSSNYNSMVKELSLTGLSNDNKNSEATRNTAAYESLARSKVENFLNASQKGSAVDKEAQDRSQWESTGGRQPVVLDSSYRRDPFPWEEDSKGVQKNMQEEVQKTYGSLDFGEGRTEISCINPESARKNARSNYRGTIKQEKAVRDGSRDQIDWNASHSMRNDSVETKDREDFYNIFEESVEGKGNMSARKKQQGVTWKGIKEEAYDESFASRRLFDSSKDKERADLMAMIMNLQKELEEKDQEINELQREKMKEEMENQRILEEVEQVEQAKKKNEQAIQELKVKSVNQVKEINTLKKCKEGLERNLKEFGGKSKEFKEYSMKIRAYREEIDKITQEIAQLNQKLEKVNVEEVEVLEDEKKARKEEAKRLEEEIRNKEEEIGELEKELKVIKEKEDEYVLVEQKIAELEALQGELMEENDNLRERLESFFKERKNNIQERDQNMEARREDLRRKELKEMEDVSSDLAKASRRLGEIESYSRKIMKILEYSKQGKEIPIELILPHNRATPKMMFSKNKFDGAGELREKMSAFELNSVIDSQIKSTEEIRKRLEQSIGEVLEEYLRKDGVRHHERDLPSY